MVKEAHNKWFKSIGLTIFFIIITIATATIFIYSSHESNAYIISKGFTAGAASGIIAGAIIREKTKKELRKRQNILLGIAFLAIFLILGWSFYTDVLSNHGSAYRYIEGLTYGTLFTLSIYLAALFYTRTSIN
ncbi:MAG: hypothetical protein J7K61_05795 [Thermoplasmata archaeon]|nr:hypothetical protein [Thermoplasmata archaeon]